MNLLKSDYRYVVLCSALTLLCMGSDAFGQASKKAGSSKKKAENRIKIERLPPPNKTAVIRTPEYDVNVQNTMSKVSRKPREWALFEAKYSTSAKWTDELTFNFYVMTKGVDENKKEIFNFYATTVRYIDIPKGDHMSCAAIPPSQIERYGKPVAVALEIIDKDGEIADSKSETTIKFPEKWWKNSTVLDSAKVKRRPGMIDRSKTPFALVNIDDYEVVQ